jgi:hypothetical protein
MTRALGRLAARQSGSTTHVLSAHPTETQYMTPFDEMTWTINDSTAATTYVAQADMRPQGALGVASLICGITSWIIVTLFFLGARSHYGGYSMLASTGGAIVLGALGTAPVITKHRVRRGAAIAGLTLGLAVIVGFVVLVGIAIFALAMGDVQLG